MTLIVLKNGIHQFNFVVLKSKGFIVCDILLESQSVAMKNHNVEKGKMPKKYI